MTDKHRQSGASRRAFWTLLASVLVCVGLSIAALPLIERSFLLRAGKDGSATLTLAVEGLEAALQRYQPLPALIAERPQLQTLLSDPTNEALVAQINAELKHTAAFVEASDIYLLDASGLTIAASNYDLPRSFVGRNFAFRPYFTEALDGGLGRYFALGTTSLERGYFYAAPVREGGRTLGVVALKFTVDAFEAAWRDGDSHIVVSDLNGVVFMSDRRDWHFRTLSPLTDGVLARIEATRQYPMDRIAPLDVAISPLRGAINMASVGSEGAYVASARAIPEAGWSVTIFGPTGPARTQALIVLSLLILIILLAGGVAGFFLQRRAQLQERLERQQRQKELLEQRVSARTKDLNAANRQLVQEIEDRKATETRLRKTQTELVQAGKLAALGQMSAALSHEFNQPLAAVKAYAENAATFLERDRAAEARKNIGLISHMADRMATISKHLRNFARRPQEKIGPVPLIAAMEDALALMGPRLKGTEVRFDKPAAEIMVMGGRVRLQQVLVNLLSNAQDAMETLEHPVIDVTLRREGERRMIDVRDRGPGLSETAEKQLFDPFFTTKSPGKGLGLGLSISYNIVRDFGGVLKARTHPEGGAVFTVDLLAATSEDKRVAAE